MCGYSVCEDYMCGDRVCRDSAHARNIQNISLNVFLDVQYLLIFSVPDPPNSIITHIPRIR